MFDPDYDVLIEILESGSISAAARARGTSVASLSKRLSRLERRIGARLVHRTTRRLHLTVAGQDLCDVLKPMRGALETMEDRIAGRLERISGPLRITAPTSFGRMHIIPHLPSFLESHPEVDLSIDLSDEINDLLASRYDLAIRIGVTIEPHLQSRRLGTNSRVLCASPSYLAIHGEPKSLDDLGQHRVLATRSQLPWFLDGPEGSIIHHGQSYIQTNSSEVVSELALAGCGIALRSLWDVSNSLLKGSLKRVLPSYLGSREAGIFAAYAPGTSVPQLVERFIAHLANALDIPETA